MKFVRVTLIQAYFVLMTIETPILNNNILPSLSPSPIFATQQNDSCDASFQEKYDSQAQATFWVCQGSLEWIEAQKMIRGALKKSRKKWKKSTKVHQDGKMILSSVKNIFLLIFFGILKIYIFLDYRYSLNYLSRPNINSKPFRIT